MKQRGATLMELAIGIVIIGLILAGIISSKDLIKQAQLKSVLNDIEKYKAASKDFQFKYGALPGDFTKATTIWSTAAGNGDGDNLIDLMDDDGLAMREDLYAWQHLVLAGSIPGSYTGALSSGTLVGGVNVPKTKIDGGVYWYVGRYFIAPSTSDFDNYRSTYHQYPNKILVGKVSGGLPHTGIFLPADVWWMDKKIDDGIPTTGIVEAGGWYETLGGASCLTGTSYNLTSSTLCIVAFMMPI